MDSESSDDEYFDSISNLNDTECIPCIASNNDPKTLIELTTECCENHNLNNCDNKISNPSISIDDSKDLLKSENLSKINNPDIGKGIEDFNSEITSDKSAYIDTKNKVHFPNKNVLYDSSESESLSDLDNSEINDSKVNTGNNFAEAETVNDTKIEKSNEEIQLDERLKLEELMPNEDLYNLKTNSLIMKDNGNSCFKSQSFTEAIEFYTNAIYTCPLKFKDDHAIFYSNRGAALAKIDKTEEAIKDLSTAIHLKPDYLKALIRRAELFEKTDKFTEALEDYRLILKIDPGNWSALHAEQTLPEKIRIQQEKMKEEMFGQLKQLGNLVLKPFGLSTDNFKMVQDPATGSYSINFQK